MQQAPALLAGAAIAIAAAAASAAHFRVNIILHISCCVAIGVICIRFCILDEIQCRE
jgi:hypothetical protein